MRCKITFLTKILSQKNQNFYFCFHLSNLYIENEHSNNFNYESNIHSDGDRFYRSSSLAHTVAMILGLGLRHVTTY